MEDRRGLLHGSVPADDAYTGSAVAEPVRDARATFRQSNGMDGFGSGANSLSMAPRPTEMKIMAAEFDSSLVPEDTRTYRGRYKRWPGVVGLLAMFAVAAALITYGAISTSQGSSNRAKLFERAQKDARGIKDGKTNGNDLVEDDGQIGNPKEYANMGCEQPNYLSKNGKIYAQAANGTEVAVSVKGVNWFGMETGMNVPLGLWENAMNGTTSYEIASFLSRNKYNSVRLPVCVESLLLDKGPDEGLVNLHSNRALNITTYMSTLQSIIASLAYRHITVMISVHTLTTKESGGAWYSEDLGVSNTPSMDAIDLLTSNLCSEKYWNVLGLDLKNEPHECSWGGDAPDWQEGATKIGKRMLKGCDKWLAFVEGINEEHKAEINGVENTVYDWWGGGLAKAGKNPIDLDTKHKLVWAPHYYNTAVTPAWYLYDGGEGGPDATWVDYEELDDETLTSNVEETMKLMFGYLNEDIGEDTPAMVLGEFAGLYATDKHEKKTTKRTTDATIKVMIKDKYAGGYMWSLNPESAYQYNPASEYGHFTEGLLLDDWLTPNSVFVKGMEAMDELEGLKPFPCFPVKIDSSDDD